MSNPGEIMTPEMIRDALDSWGYVKPDRKVTLPSGASVTLRQLEIPDLVSLGVLDKMDSFTPKVLGTGKKKKNEDPAISSEKMADLVKVLDSIAVAAIVNPKVSPDPEDGKFVEGVRYASKIPMEDKMFVFQNSFSGMEEFFRLGGGQAASLGNVASVEADPPASE